MPGFAVAAQHLTAELPPIPPELAVVDPFRPYSFSQILILDMRLLVFMSQASTLLRTNVQHRIWLVSLFGEPTRRDVFRVGVACIVTMWLLIQVAETIFPFYGFGDSLAHITFSTQM